MLKLKYMWALLLLPLIWLLLMTSVAIPAIGHAKSYIKVVQGDYITQSVQSSAALLASDIDRVVLGLLRVGLGFVGPAQWLKLVDADGGRNHPRGNGNRQRRHGPIIQVQVLH